MEFFTIGLVMCEDPGEQHAYRYKQSVTTIDKRYRLVRIQQILNDNIIRTSGFKALRTKQSFFSGIKNIEI